MPMLVSTWVEEDIFPTEKQDNETDEQWILRHAEFCKKLLSRLTSKDAKFREGRYVDEAPKNGFMFYFSQSNKGNTEVILHTDPPEEGGMKRMLDALAIVVEDHKNFWS